MFKEIFWFLLIVNGIVFGQLPSTAIIKFKIVKGDKYTISEPKHLSKRKGYNNQPSFSKSEKQIIFVSDSSGNQTDIYSLNIKSGKWKQLTKTEESEYSPQYHEDGITCVRVLKDSSQVLQTYNAKANEFLSDRYINIDSIGYYEFLNGDTLLYYKLTEPHTLRMKDFSNGNEIVICKQPVRSFKKINRHSFVYAVSDSLQTMYFVFETVTKLSELIGRSEFRGEDFIYHNQLGLLVAHGTKIFSLKTENNWKLLFDLNEFGVRHISRFLIDKKISSLIIVDKID
ncbi:MAG: TolB family protein [Bacteroidia bacterium]